jgi:SAM-dependent methyltransferase
LQRAWKKTCRLLNASLFEPDVTSIVLSERIVEYPLLFKHLDLAPGQKVLDFGCVESLLPMQLCSLGYNVTGLDFRPYPFTHRNFDFICSDIMAWQPPADYFDAVISISVLEHIGLSGYGDPESSEGDRLAVQKLFRALKVGGRIYLTVPAGRSTTAAGWYKVYDSSSLRQMIPGIEVLRFFAKRGRYDAWEECGAAEIDSLVYEDYSAMAPVQGVAFIVARKGQAE